MSTSSAIPTGSVFAVLRSVPREHSVGGLDLIENDIAVIEISSFNDEAARARFLALQGLALYGGGDILVGEAGRSLGVSWVFQALPPSIRRAESSAC
jgi:hypothetical protein